MVINRFFVSDTLPEYKHAYISYRDRGGDGYALQQGDFAAYQC